MKNSNAQIIELDTYEIKLDIEDGGGSISSRLKDDESDPDNELFNAAMDGIESLILAHACVGVDVTSPAYKEGIETAVEACENNL